MQPGDNVRLFLNISSNSDFPAYVDGTVITAVPTTRVVGLCVRTVTVYSFEYDSAQAGAVLVPDDILQLECISCCSALGSRVAFLEADHVPVALSNFPADTSGPIRLTGSISTADSAINAILFDDLLPVPEGILGVPAWTTDGEADPSGDPWIIVHGADFGSGNQWFIGSSNDAVTLLNLWTSVTIGSSPVGLSFIPGADAGAGNPNVVAVEGGVGLSDPVPGQYIKTARGGFITNPDGTYEQVSGDQLKLIPVIAEPATPTAGIVLYVQAGVLKVKDSSGIVKTVTLV